MKTLSWIIYLCVNNLPGMQYQHFVHIDRLSHAPQDQNSPKLTPKIQKKPCWCSTFLSALNFILLLLRRNVHTALQLFAMRLAVFLKVFSR